MLICANCLKEFTRPGKHGPVPRFCSIACKAKSDRRNRPELREYAREYRRARRASGKLDAYEYAYNRKPEVKAKNRDRMRHKWWTDEAFRNKVLDRLRSYARIRKERLPDIPAPYTGHRWLKMAHDLVNADVNPDMPWSEYQYDDMGEATLAILEGRDPREAVRKYRSQEFNWRYLNRSLSEWRYSDDGEHEAADYLLPPTPSAEDEALVRLDNYERAARFDDVSVHDRHNAMRNKQSSPSNRRSNNK